MPRVAAIHDLSGLGRCSLTAAIPILSVMGVQACPLPTAVLSGQTGFPDYAIETLTGHMREAAASWERQQLCFDGVYTGFLADVEQVRLTGEFIRATQETGRAGLVLVDPVLGDDGVVYPVFGPAMVNAVRELVGIANAITPNITEACLLAGAAVNCGPDDGDVWALARALADLGPRIVVISGVCRGEELCNFAYQADGDRRIRICNHRIGGGRSGTGDILASVLCGALVRAEPVEKALGMAAALLEASVADAVAEELDPNDGVPFERHLRLLL